MYLFDASYCHAAAVISIGGECVFGDGIDKYARSSRFLPVHLQLQHCISSILLHFTSTSLGPPFLCHDTLAWMSWGSFRPWLVDWAASVMVWIITWGNLHSKQAWNYIFLFPLPPFFLHTCGTCFSFFWCLHIQTIFMVYIMKPYELWLPFLF